MERERGRLASIVVVPDGRNFERGHRQEGEGTDFLQGRKQIREQET